MHACIQYKTLYIRRYIYVCIYYIVYVYILEAAICFFLHLPWIGVDCCWLFCNLLSIYFMLTHKYIDIWIHKYILYIAISSRSLTFCSLPKIVSLSTFATCRSNSNLVHWLRSVLLPEIWVNITKYIDTCGLC